MTQYAVVGLALVLVIGCVFVAFSPMPETITETRKIEAETDLHKAEMLGDVIEGQNSTIIQLLEDLNEATNRMMELYERVIDLSKPSPWPWIAAITISLVTAFLLGRSRKAPQIVYIQAPPVQETLNCDQSPTPFFIEAVSDKTEVVEIS
jgi:hypothetical protein